MKISGRVEVQLAQPGPCDAAEPGVHREGGNDLSDLQWRLGDGPAQLLPVRGPGHGAVDGSGAERVAAPGGDARAGGHDGAAHPERLHRARAALLRRKRVRAVLLQG